MKHRFVLLAIALLALLALASGNAVAAGGSPSRHDFTEAPFEATQSDYAVVVFNDPPAASYAGGIPGLAPTQPPRGQRLNPRAAEVVAYAQYLREVHANYRSFLAQAAPRAEIVREFVLTANAVVVRTNGARLRTLRQGPGVRYATYSALYRPTMNISVGLIGASALWPLVGGHENAGAGVKVGIIDSGIDDSHDFFACKDEIVHKVYASGVAFFDPDNAIVFDHGTHVAGTVGGCVITLTEGPITGTISGIAPAAELWDYNVFPGFGAGYVAFGGSAFSHDIAAALEDAVADGMDVVNMSLGGGVQGPHDFLAEVVNATVEAGVVVAVAAGNSGPGDMTIESPGSAANALTAGASTNPHYIGITVFVNSPSGLGPFGAALGDFNNFDPALTADYSTTTPANGCTTIAEDLTGKIALIRRGACTFTTKIRNAQNAGAAGVIMMNNTPGDPIAMGHDGTDPFPTIPAAMISKEDGDALVAASTTGNLTVDGTSPAEFVTANADILAGFSSRGPTPFTYLIKPDVTAPGVNVYSSVFDNKFAMFQGTSMATPHLAGAAALLRQMHPDWSPFDIKSALVNTAEDTVSGAAGALVDPGVLARGNGRVNVYLASQTPVTFDPVSISFGFWGGNKRVRASADLLLHNVSGAPLTCNVVITGDPYVSVSSTSLTLGAGDTVPLTVSLDAGRSSTTASGDYDGDLWFDCGGTTLQVPWWVRIDREAKP